MAAKNITPGMAFVGGMKSTTNIFDMVFDESVAPFVWQFQVVLFHDRFIRSGLLSALFICFVVEVVP